MPLPGREPLPSRDASLGPTSVSPARVAWHGMVQLAQHGLAWLLMARQGTALLLIPFRTRSPLDPPAQPYFGAHWHIRHQTPVLHQLKSPLLPSLQPHPAACAHPNSPWMFPGAEQPRGC